MFTDKKTRFCQHVTFSNFVSRFNNIAIKISGKMMLKLIWTGKRLRLADRILKNNHGRGQTLAHLRTYYKPTVIRTLYTGKITTRSMEQNKSAQK
jgi:hypothetical protein